MTKRIAGLAIAAAAAATFVLPAAPAHAQCINPFTTPVDCALEAVDEAVPSCVYLGTFEMVCVSASG